LAEDEKSTEAEMNRLLALQATGDNRKARAELIAAGQTPDSPSTSQELSNAITRLGDIRLARKIQRDRLQDVIRREGSRLCQELKPQYEALAKREADALVELHDVRSEIFELKSGLMGRGIGFYPIICNVDSTTVFGEPNDPGSHFANLLRECVKFGHLSKLPKGLR
jgi:hypothetical protein